MAGKTPTLKCLSCGQTDQAIPLLTLSYNGSESWICPQCLPVLIHHREKLADRLATIAKDNPV